MGNVDEDGDIYKACTECCRVCQTTHGKGLPHSVPKFYKAISEYSTPSSTSCSLLIPAPYIRNHIHQNKEKYVLESAPGCEWVVTFDKVGFKKGWKEFATDYQLQKGDGVMLSQVASRKFYVTVFDKFGVEKVSTKQPRASASTLISHKENHVATSASGGGADLNQCTPLDNGTNLHREGKSNGTPHHTLPNSNGGGAGTSGQHGNHDKRTLSVDKHHLPNEPVGHEAEPSMSQSSDDSDDSIQVRLAKAVLAKARQKKLMKKKQKTSCTSPPQVETAPEGTTTKSGGTLGADSTRNDGTAASVDEAMFENPCEEPRVLNIGANIVTPEVQTEQHEKVVQEEAQRPSETLPLRRVEVNPAAGDAPRPVFLPSFVKLEPHTTSPDLIKMPPTCVNCGLMKEPTLPKTLKSEPVTSDSPDFRSPEARSPSSNASRRGRVTEYQKQRALAAAAELSANLRNPNALVVMRIGFSSCDCFLSAKCTVMLPPVRTEFTLMDTEGNARRTNWDPESRHINGPGWKDFVDSHNLQVIDACVLEVINPSERNLVVKIHILHAHQMERSPEPPQQQPPPPAGLALTTGAPKTPAVTAPVPTTGVAKTPAVAAQVPTGPTAGVPKTSAVAAQVPTIGVAKTPAVTTQVPTAGVVKTPAVTAPTTGAPKTPAVFPTAPTAGASKTPAVTARVSTAPTAGTPKTPAVTAQVPVLGLGAKTRSSNQLHGPIASPSKTNKRGRTPNEQTEIPRPSATNTTDDDRALIELTRQSPIKRPRRGTSSSPSAPRIRAPTGEEPQAPVQAKPARKVKQKATRRRHSLYNPHGQKKAKAEVAAAAAAGKGGGGGASQSASKVQLRSSELANVNANANSNAKRKQVRTRNSQKVHYKVAKVLDRRKSLQGSLFLVELTEKVSPERIHKRMKAQQDDKGRWWVPQNHFTTNLSSCYIE